MKPKVKYFTPTRLIAARQFRGYSRKFMCDGLGITRQRYRGFEDKEYSNRFIFPTDAEVARMALLLNFPVGWFTADELDLVHARGINGWISGSQYLDAQIDADLERIAGHSNAMVDA